MASCITTSTIYAFATSGTTTKTAYSLPVLTVNANPSSCALVAMTGTEYGTLNTNLNTAVTNAANANSVASTAYTTASNAITVATSANTTANAANTTATSANNGVSTATTTANNALTNASLANQTAASAEDLATQALTLAQNISSEFGNFNYTDAAAMWGFAFSMTFGLWYLSKNIGLIINAVRKW